MAARTDLILTDGQATPVAHTFTPDGSDANGVHIFSEKSGIPADDSRFTVSLRRSGGRFRVSIKLAVPVTQLQTVNGVSNPLVVRTGYAEVGFTFDETSSMQERWDVVRMLSSALGADQAQIEALVVGLSDIY
jgi:hypothetical protein